MKIIYLHGFASTGTGNKSNAPDLPIDPDAVEELVDSIVREANDDIIFVGTSLGGFWSNYFAHKWNMPCVIVNPSVSPSKIMWERAGGTFKNYVTGALFQILEVFAEKFEVREKFIAENYDGDLINVFLAKDDEIIPYETSIVALPDCASFTVTEDGGHRYDVRWDQVVIKVVDLSTQNQ